MKEKRNNQTKKKCFVFSFELFKPINILSNRIAESYPFLFGRVPDGTTNLLQLK